MSSPSAKKWDGLVRITHWGIAAAIVANGVLVRGGGGLHVWVGCAAAGLLTARIVWGLIGTAPARFAAFPPNPVAAARHVGDIVAGRREEHPSHNPLGALMVWALWAVLALVVLSGIALRQSELASVTIPGAGAVGAIYPGLTGENGEELWEEVHEVAANLLFLLAALHVAGVVFETRRLGSHVARAMIGGRRG